MVRLQVQLLEMLQVSREGKEGEGGQTEKGNAEEGIRNCSGSKVVFMLIFLFSFSFKGSKGIQKKRASLSWVFTLLHMG